ncbi:MAG: hypothetical protein QOG64_775 [Acidimicrobiaceae bacterium]|nr:hypothetical protein [Acidimicrobiaceae bacterium]
MDTVVDIPAYETLSEQIDDADRPWLDRHDIDESALDDDCRSWRERGVVVLPGLLPDDLIDRYTARFERYHCLRGFQTPTPYEHLPELRDLALHPRVMATINKLIGDEMILHLNLTGWVSSERKWHQDDYLNSPNINGWYVAVWMALDDVTPESGPFQYIPQSHRWPVLRQSLVRKLMTPEQDELDARDPNAAWTLFTQDQVAASVEQHRQELGLPYESFLARKGDVLVWHACLHHRGSPPTLRTSRLRSGLRATPLRKALISHYTARSRIPLGEEQLATHPGGGRYGVFNHHLNHFVGGDAAPRDWRIAKRMDWALRQRR